MNIDASTAYDAVAYPSRSCPQAHPDRLATLATLFGMTPAPVDRCRVLELGCGDGGNLLPMAFSLPGSAFVGVDLAPSAIAKANEDARAFGLANVAYHCADVLDWTPPDGPFDYVIAHGFFSWVPEGVRLRALELCRDRLAPHGVAFISYNALPGNHVRGMLRDMMRFHTQHISSPAQKVDQAKSLLRLLAIGSSGEDEFAALLKKEAARYLEGTADPLLFHDALAEINRSYYFHEFAALAGRHGLQYLAEADFAEMQTTAYPAPVVAALRSLGDDVVLMEQYLDFLKCRRFRQTLLCRAEVSLSRHFNPRIMQRLLIASRAKPKSSQPSLDAGVLEGFTGSRGVTMNVDEPLPKAALLELTAAWPRALPLGELMDASWARLGRPPRPADVADAESRAESEALAAALLAGYAVGVVDLHVYQPAWTAAQDGRPVLTPLVRRQLDHGWEVVTGLRHTDTRVDSPMLRAMFLLLDGSRDVAAVAEELAQRLDAGELPLPRGATRATLHADVDQAVRDAGAAGLLLGWGKSR